MTLEELLASQKVYTVSEIANFLYKIISQNIGQVYIKGEISNIKKQPNGNVFFSIKDKEAKLNALMFSDSKAKRNINDLIEGKEVIVYGSVSYYKKEGNITLIVEDIYIFGKGLLYLKFEELKKKLDQEGLFSNEHKKPIPKFPHNIGIITSPTGAAIRDILNILTRRFPGINIIIFPVSVQGDEASIEIKKAIEVANNFFKNILDVIILARGGGSIEDLWCFNEEIVARAIYKSEIPIITGIGHEIDYTIADFVADLRAPTPSAAAEIVVPEKRKIIEYTQYLKNRINFIINEKLDKYKLILENKGKTKLKSLYANIISTYHIQLQDLKNRFNLYFTNCFNTLRSSINLYKEKLNTLNPLNILNRGYSITYKVINENERIILKSIKSIKNGDIINTVLVDGEFKSKIE